MPLKQQSKSSIIINQLKARKKSSGIRLKQTKKQ